MRKAGLSFWQERKKHGLTCRFYRITRQEFLTRRDIARRSFAG